MKRILVVEDEIAINEMVKEILESYDYEVDQAFNGMEGLEKFNEKKYDIVISDIMMPLMDGYELVKIIRNKNKKIPLVMLTAKREEEDEVIAFDLGISDYIKKPFSIKILLHRINNLLTGEIEDIIESGELRIDTVNYKVYKKEKQIELTLKEFNILVYLINRKNRVVSRDQIVENIWGFEYYKENRIVDNHIKNIRKKINIKNIKTIKGVGYMYETK